MYNTREILNDCNEFFTISNLFEIDLRFTDDVSFMYHYEIYTQQFPDIMENIYSFIDLRLSDFLLVLPQDDDFSEYLSFFSKKPKVSMKYAIISYLEANDMDKLFADKTIRNAYVEISGSLDSEIIDIIKELYENGFKKTKKYWYMDIKKRHPRIYFVREFFISATKKHESAYVLGNKYTEYNKFCKINTEKSYAIGFYGKLNPTLRDAFYHDIVQSGVNYMEFYKDSEVMLTLKDSTDCMYTCEKHGDEYM